MMTQPASVFVIAFTAINIVACLWLMWWTARVRATGTEAQPKQAPENARPAAPGKTGHVWDGIEEYNNPLPRWWLGLFILTVVFGAAYLIFYPGLGNFGGLGKWNSIHAYEQQMREQRQQLEERLAPLKDKSLRELAADPSAMSTARNLFGANCSTCHGSDARGATGFPNLTDGDWLWGAEENTVYETIAKGRHGVMPALGSALGDTGVNEVASYVLSLSGAKAPADWIAAGKQRFDSLCVGCHGMDARGNPALGAPNLTDDVWLHGGDFDAVRATITGGRDNQMPAHAEFLGDTKVRLLAAYVLSLSQQHRAAVATVQRPLSSEANKRPTPNVRGK